MERQAQLEQRRSLVVSVVRASPLDVMAWLDGETMATVAHSGQDYDDVVAALMPDMVRCSY